MHESGVIWFNGKLVPWADARIHVVSHVCHYGTGVFEGIRAYVTRSGAAILGLSRHVERLFRSCKIMGIPLPYTREEMSAAICRTVVENGSEACYLRPLVFLGYGNLGVMPTNSPTDVAVIAVPWGTLHGENALEHGVDVGVSSWRRMAPDTHPAMAKAVGNYVNSLMVIREARRHGYQEGIVLDVDGYVSEGSGENLYVVHEGEVYTPPLGGSILPGITRGFVLELLADFGIPVRQQRFSREMLYIADEVFMSGTAAEITPVRTVDALPVGTGVPGPITKRVQADFFGIVRGELPDRHGWLHFVQRENL
jgi:branched-chain amino acid aminotransferase